MQSGDRGPRDFSEDPVRFHFVNDLDLRDCLQLLLQQACHAVGMPRALLPEIAGEQGVKLRGDEAHLGGELHALLAQIQEVVGQLLVEENHGFCSHRAVFCSAEGEHVHSQVPRGLPQGLSQAGGGVGDAGAVHVQEHAALVCESGQRFYFLRLVHRPHFSGLGDGDDAGLHMVRIIDAMIGLADGFDRQFAVGDGNGNEFAAGEFLRRPAFVGVDMRGFAADYRMIRIGQSFQAEAIGRGAVKDEEDFNIRAEALLEFLHHRLGVGIVAIADRMAVIGFSNHGSQDLRMNSGIVVAGKTAGRFHVRNNVAEAVWGGHSCPPP